MDDKTIATLASLLLLGVVYVAEGPGIAFITTMILIVGIGYLYLRDYWAEQEWPDSEGPA
jgi:hypothetical protein